MISIYQLLENMLALVDKGASIPFFAKYKLVDVKQLQDLIKKAVSELPPQIAASKEIVSKEKDIIHNAHTQANQIIAQANAQATRIIEQAKSKSEEYLDKSEIIKAVNIEANKIREQVKGETTAAYDAAEKSILQTKEKAQRDIDIIINEANQEADKIKYNAYTYAQYVLEQLEIMTSGSLDVIQGGKHQLNNLKEQIQYGLNSPESKTETYKSDSTAFSAISSTKPTILVD